MLILMLRRQGLLAEAAAAGLVIRVALRFCSLPRAVRIAGATSALFFTTADAGECVEAARLMTRRVAHQTCLYRALTTYALLSRRHRHVAFHIGALRAHAICAHAWVSVAGRPLDSEADQYVPLWTAPSPNPVI